jgi:hypothetical protein
MSRSPFLIFIMVVGGLILLLPGVCSVFFMTALPGGGDSTLAVLWLFCFAISAGGIALIVKAFR